MFRYTMIMPLLFLCITAGADVSQREAIVTIPQIVDNGSFADLFNYLKNNEDSGENYIVKVAMQDRKKFLEQTRDGYYMTYTIFQLAFDIAKNTGVGIGSFFGWNALHNKLNKDSADELFSYAVVITCIGVAGFAAKNILTWGYSIFRAQDYMHKEMDLQLSRLELLLKQFPLVEK